MRIGFSPFVLILFVLTSTASAQILGRGLLFDDGAGRQMAYRLASPDVVEPGVEYPLIVFLHGSGGRGFDTVSHIGGIDDLFAAARREYPSYVVAPQLAEGNFSWHPEFPEDLTMEIIESLQMELPIDSTRIYITGVSMGGFGTMSYLTARPEVFAAGVPVAGGGPTFLAFQVSDVPTWFFHGDADGAVSVDNSRNMFRAIDAEGGVPLLSEIQRGEHAVWEQVYEDWQTENYGLYPWLLAQSTGRRETAAIVPLGSEWRYLDDGSNQGTAWQAAGFDDSSWAVGAGEFGYGDQDETTVVSCGQPVCRGSNLHPTTYFRKTFNVDDPSQYWSLEGQVLRDDAVAVYLNGEEVFRDERGLPAGAGFDQFASLSVENSWEVFLLDPEALQPGENVLAIEVHTANRSGDLSFDLRLAARIGVVPEPATGATAMLSMIALAMVARRRRAAS